MTVYSKKPHIFIIQGIKTYLWFEREKIPGFEPMIDIRIRWEAVDENPYHEINFHLTRSDFLLFKEYGFVSASQMIRHYTQGLLREVSRTIEKQQIFQYD